MPGRGRRSLLWLASALAMLGALLLALWAPSGAGARPFLKGYAEPQFHSANAGERSFSFGKSVEANSNLARINMSWRAITNAEPIDPANPADPAYNFSRIDMAVSDAVATGHRVLLTIYNAPGWAEGPNRPSPQEAYPGTWKPDPAAFGQFAQAVATRYSGTFPAPGPAALPVVKYFEAWNEPNLPEYLAPQDQNGKLYSASHFRDLVNAFGDGIARSPNDQAQVVAGSTSPYGDEPGSGRTRPLRFWRGVFCLNAKLRKAGKCRDRARFDILGHHPITLSGGPHRSAIDPDDAAMPDFKNVVKTVRAAERRHTVAGGRHPVWATEIWWETNPPDAVQGKPLGTHARWVQEALYLLWKQKASAVIWLQLIDANLGADGFSGIQGGHLFADRTEKPSFAAYSFPFVADRRSKRKVNVWTIAPSNGSLRIQRKAGGDFKTIDRMAVRDGKPRQTNVRLKGKTELRGMLDGRQSLAYRVK